ncbi:MAG: sterol desaturase family protein [Cryobacterium sp.]|nr:sterol desaturase family protein [Oligoflexia bacterium]
MQQVRATPNEAIPDALRSNGVKRVYPRDSVRLFKSDFLETFTHVHPAVPLILWVPVIVALTYRSFSVHGNSLGGFALFAFFGLFIWTLTEYLLHRFAFHFPATSPRGRRFVYIMHGLHHEDPADPTRLVMPPLPAFIYAFLLFTLFRLTIGSEHVEAFMAAFMVGYLAYDYTHFYVHHFVPKNRIGKYLKRYHMVHHYSDHDAKWGVSNPLWDYIFRTTELKTSLGSAASSATTKTHRA